MSCNWDGKSLVHGPTGLIIYEASLDKAIDTLVSKPAFLAWFALSGEWTWDGVKLYHSPSGVVKHHMSRYDAITGLLYSRDFRDWIKRQINLGFVKVDGWYIHWPTGRASKSLSELVRLSLIRSWLRDFEGFDFGISGSLWTESTYNGPSKALIDILTNEEFVAWLEDRING